MLPTTMEQLEQIRMECKKLVTKRAAVSGSAALMPLPGTDIAADLAILMEMLPEINHRFGLSEAHISRLDHEKKALVYSIIKTAGSKLVGQMITRGILLEILKKFSKRIAIKQAAKLMPVVGQGLAAGLSFTAMKYVGNKHVEDCYTVAKKMLEHTDAAKALPAP